MKLRLVLCACLVIAGTAAPAACGGDDEPAAPTTVSPADLEKDGEFWASLSPDLKDELIEIAQDRLGEERPDGASEIDALAAAELTGEMEKQYANESKRDQEIYAVYRQANDLIARRRLEELIPQIEGSRE